MNGISSVGTMPYGYDSSMALMSGDLNGLASPLGGNGYNTGFTGGFIPYTGYGYGGNVGNVESAKDSIKNQYDIYATQQSYGNMQGVENMSFNQRSTVIAEMLRSGRQADAMSQFEVLTAELKSSPQYSQYTDSQLKAIACSVYRQSTGENLVEAIRNNAPSSFVKGLEGGFPLIGTLFSDNTSREDLISKVTGTPTRLQDQVAKSTGAVVSGAIGGAAIGTVAAGIGACVAAGSISGAIAGGGIFSLPAALIGGAIGLGVGLIKSLIPSK